MHYPKLLVAKLRPYLVYQRQLVYFIYVMSKNNLLQKLSQTQKGSVSLAVRLIRECLDALLQVPIC